MTTTYICIMYSWAWLNSLTHVHNLFEPNQDSFTHAYNILMHICHVLPVIVSFQEGSKVRAIKILCR